MGLTDAKKLEQKSSSYYFNEIKNLFFFLLKKELPLMNFKIFFRWLFRMG